MSNNPFYSQADATAGHDPNYGKHLSVEQTVELTGSKSPLRPSTPERGSRESSPTRSEYEESPAETSSLAGGPTKTLDFMHTSSHIDVRIVDPSTGTCVYYVENSAFTPKKPDVLLFQGDEKQGFPLVGVARWSSMWSKSVEIGLGDPGSKGQHGTDIPWESLESTSRTKQNEHHFRVPGDPAGRGYVWKRTHDLGDNDPKSNSWSASSFKLLDAQTGEVLALFSSNRWKSWHKLGKLTVRTGRSPQWDLMVLLGCLSLIEKTRRRSRARRGGAGSGGGGNGGGS